jgi:S-DNA-T family DNA segregation ATPase FtsK/SpoIIIE
MARQNSSTAPLSSTAKPTLPFFSSLFPASFLETINRRFIQLFGGLLVFLGLALIAIIFSYDHSDASLNSAAAGPIKNLFGVVGSHIADLMLQIFGVAGLLPSLIFVAWGWRLLRKKRLSLIWLRILALITGIIIASIAISLIPQPQAWPLRAGLGGVAGQSLLISAMSLLAPLNFYYDALCVVILSGLFSITALIYASGLNRSEWYIIRQRIVQLTVLIWRGIRLLGTKAYTAKRRLEPTLRPNEDCGNAPDNAEHLVDELEKAVLKDKKREDSKTALVHGAKAELVNKFSAVIPKSSEAEASGKPPKTQQQKKPQQLNLDVFRLPPLNILDVVPPRDKVEKADKAVLAESAQLLESVLIDFGVKGKIVKIRPGPVVTLYELEPAPGTKTSRVVGLSDDIARSMSAMSVRIAVVPGRTVIGIELPNTKRDAVFFRELLASSSYQESTASLPLVLGKDIGGEPCIVDLAKMPHLLIAGTTGSGKSVAINTMICSLLYRLNPNECKFIMVDPKMLELSVYDGIPNLLAPVVTDPAKAITALKWAVREMEDRYRLMSQMGVRNITGYNERLKEAHSHGEEITRRVQTGFNESGQPTYEDQPLSTDPLPLIVIVVDEMADLMMVAGKDIEALIQRLAQMARAAGIHLIMATQRPSVDVITGTIKANFPTRISFQVTSKIDSRTILGEQGAEQLLGQGDMLYMAGGGQITRVHGPFVSDDEVEQIVRCLKDQGDPAYIEAVTEDLDGGFDTLGVSNTENSDALYDEAVAIVTQEGKASTSFIQRRLQIGYNRAARIIEQMEAQEVVSKADRVGRREVLVGTH